MLFSVIVPIYNVDKYLKRCIESLVNQTYHDIEIILVDDGSSDNSPQICDDYQKNDSRIKVIHKINGGLSDARNAGLDTATGDYIFFVDADDYISVDACEKFVDKVNKGYDILIGEAMVESGANRLSHILPQDKVYAGNEYLIHALREKKAPMAVWLNVYRRKFLVENSLNFKYGILHEDEQFTPRALLAAESVLVTGIYFYHYIIRDDSITTKKDKRKNAHDLFESCCELEMIYNDIKNKHLRNMLLDSLVKKYLSLFQDGALHNYGNKYIHKNFVIRNSKAFRTMLKSILFVISPKMYWNINNFLKK